MITLGLVGGVASGKSCVAREFEKLGAHILDGDRLGHEVLAGQAVIQELVTRWGEQIRGPQGDLDRSKIAKIVFGPQNRHELAFLESVTHPQIEKRLRECLAGLTASGASPLAILDAAVLLKAGWDQMCDHVAFVDVPREIRLERALRRGLSKEQFEAREAAQLPVSQKKRCATLIIDNSGPLQKTSNQVKKVWHSLLQIA